MSTISFGNGRLIGKGVYLSLLQIVVAIGILMGSAYPANAGLIIIPTDPGTKPEIGWDTNGDKKADKFIGKEDINKDGKVEIGLGSLEAEKKIGSVWVLKYGDGKQIYYELKLDDSGKTLASLEPFVFPTFTSATPLVASIDIVALLATDNPFTVGQSFTVTNGVFADSLAVIFKDGSSLVDFPEFSRDLVTSLPDYTGLVNVYSTDKVVPVPLPDTFWLLSTGLICLFGVRRFSRFQI